MSKATINILMLTAFIVMMWIVTELYFLSKKDLYTELDQKLTPEKLETFDPNLDFQTIELLKRNNEENQQQPVVEETRPSSGRVSPSPTPVRNPTPTLRSR